MEIRPDSPVIVSPLHGRFPPTSPSPTTPRRRINRTRAHSFDPNLVLTPKRINTLSSSNDDSNSSTTKKTVNQRQEKDGTVFIFEPNRFEVEEVQKDFDRAELVQDVRGGGGGEVRMIGEWKLGQNLGEGTSGTVTRAKNVRTGAEAAVKQVRKAPREDPTYSLVHAEIALLKVLNPHPHIVELFDVFETPTNMYLVTEYCPVGELFHYVNFYLLSLEEIRRIFSQLVSALCHLSTLSISHRDLKLENLLLYEDSRGRLGIKLADFGMATFQRDDRLLTRSCGSPHYAAPEVIEGRHYIGGMADVWSAGIVLFALTHRRLPFDHPHVPTLLRMIKIGQYQFDEDIDVWAIDLIQRCLQRDIGKRIKVQQIVAHPFLSTCPVVIPSDEARRGRSSSISTQDCIDFENLDQSVLVAVSFILKVPLLDHVKEMLRIDRNHARYFYSKIVHFRENERTTSVPARTSMTLDECDDDDLTENNDSSRLDRSTSPTDFPFPPVSLPFAGVPFPGHIPRSASTGTLPDVVGPPALSPRRVAFPHFRFPPPLHSAPAAETTFLAHPPFDPATQPIASAPSHLESFDDALSVPPLSRLLENLDQSLRSDALKTLQPAIDLRTSAPPVRSPNEIVLTDLVNKPVRRRSSMQQRLRSLLSGGARSNLLDSTVHPSVPPQQPTRPPRPPSLAPTTSTVSSRLTRSTGYLSLGHAFLEKADSERRESIEPDFEEGQVSIARRIALSPVSVSPVSWNVVKTRPLSANAKTTERIGDDLRKLAEPPSSPSLPVPTTAAATTKDSSTSQKRAVKKRMSLGVMQFFYDDSSASSDPPKPSTVPPLPSTSNSTKATKEKRRPTPLAIAKSNLVNVNARMEPRPPTLIKKLSLLALRSSSSNRSSLLAPPSPLSLAPPTPTTSSATPDQFKDAKGESDSPVSIISALQSYPRRSGSNSLSRRSTSLVSDTPTFPLHSPPNTVKANPMRRRSTLSCAVSPIIDESPASSQRTTSSKGQQRQLLDTVSSLKVENDRLVVENRMLRATLRTKDSEIALLRDRQEEMMKVFDSSQVGVRNDDELGLRRSKSRFEDEGGSSIGSRSKWDRISSSKSTGSTGRF